MGGTERVTSNLAIFWAGTDWQVTVVTLSDGTDDVYWLSPSVQRISLVLLQESANTFLRLMNDFRRMFVLRRVLRKTKTQLALAMDGRSQYYAMTGRIGIARRGGIRF